MNERILDLAIQAKDWAYADHDGYTAQMLFEQKFAELIVRDFLDIASEVRGDEPAAATHYVIGYDRACEKMISGIKQHFGVDE
jgi:hypothetical protein